MKTNKKMNKYTIISCCTVLIVLAAWYVCINVLHLKQETVFPGPITVAKTFVQKMTSKVPDGATLPTHLMGSLKVALFGYSLGSTVWGPDGDFDGLV